MVLYQANVAEEISANSPKMQVALLYVVLGDDAMKWPYHARDIAQRLAALGATRNKLRFATLVKSASRRPLY